MFLSILIRNYNEAPDLEKTLILLKKQQISFPYEIIVSDNNSTDDSVKVAEAFGCRVVHNTSTNFSYGQLINFGISHCKGEIIMLLSAHVALLGELSVENIARPFENKTVACVCGTSATNIHLIMNGVETKLLTIAGFKDAKDWKTKEGYLFAAPCGALRKSVWEKIKFDEALEFSEDRYWNRCVLEAGFTSVYGVGCYYLYFKARSAKGHRNRAYAESLAAYRLHGKPETAENFYLRSVKTSFSDAYHSVINVPLNLLYLLKVYFIRWKKR